MRTVLTPNQQKWLFNGLVASLKHFADWGASEIAGAVASVSKQAHEMWGNETPPETDYVVENYGQFLLRAHFAH
ncbi:MAG: hypothetical protein GC129_01900 [Proteobacteria bacterium]|nr:hypothetical protein [Pseudomonadota bacterium]